MWHLEDNLEAMKAVVRTKLGISDSIPLHLSQWRDGKSVDLEDGELSADGVLP